MKKTKLLEALEIVKPGLANKEIIEQSTSFAFMGDRIVTYNDEISISHPVDDLGITGAVKSEELYQLLAKLKRDDLQISVVDNEIQIQAGKSKAGLRLQEKITLPVDGIGEIGEWQDLPETFIQHLRFVIQCCSNDMSQPILTCVHIRNDGVLESSDGFRIARCTGKEINVNDFLLPANIAQRVIAVNPMQIAEGNGWIHFRTQQETVISCRIFTEKFPTGKLDIHTQVDGKEIKLPKTISEILERASIFSKKEHFLDEMITVSIDSKKIKIRGESETGWYEEEANIRYDDAPIQFTITPYLFQDILEKTQLCIMGEDKIKFQDADWIYVGMLRHKDD